MKKIAFIVQRCGKEVNGGAEVQARLLAEKLHTFVEVEILTTCAKDYYTWKNDYPQGLSIEDDVRIRRFPVDHQRNLTIFNAFSKYINFRKKISKVSRFEEELWMRLQGPVSSALHRYIKDNKDNYDAFVFFTYLYASTYDNLPLVREKAWLFPEAHDEWAINLNIFQTLFSLPRGFFFNSHAEKHFLATRFPTLPFTGPIVGLGIVVPPNISSESFAARHNISKPFLLYIGRIDANKGCDQLIEYYLRHSAEKSSPYSLVFIGQSGMELPRHEDIHPLGFVDEQTKWEAIQACEWLINPSRFESLSLVLLEAWACARPTLANAECAVLQDQTQRSQGGLTYRNYEEFSSALTDVSEKQKRRFGANGKQFVEENYTWAKIVPLLLNELKGATS